MCITRVLVVESHIEAIKKKPKIESVAVKKERKPRDPKKPKDTNKPKRHTTAFFVFMRGRYMLIEQRRGRLNMRGDRDPCTNAIQKAKEVVGYNILVIPRCVIITLCETCYFMGPTICGWTCMLQTVLLLIRVLVYDLLYHCVCARSFGMVA